MNQQETDKLLTVGLPVKNAEDTIRQVIESLLAQTYSNFRLIISDNNSSDATAEICEGFAKLDERIQFHSQPFDLGAYANFRYVYDQAKTDFFIWVASDDVRTENHFESTMALLVNHPHAAVAGSDNTHTDGSKTNVVFEIVGSKEERVEQFLKNANKSNGVFYGMFRRNALSDYNFPAYPFLGWDWMLILELLKCGDFIRSHASHLELGTRGESQGVQRWSQWRSSPIHWVVPFLHVNIEVLRIAKSFSLRSQIQIIVRLMHLNLLALIDQLVSETRISLKQLAKSIETRQSHRL